METENFIKESNAPEKVRDKAVEMLPFFSVHEKVWVNTERQKNSIAFYFGNGKNKTIHVGVYDLDAKFYLSCDNLDTDEDFSVNSPCQKAFELAFAWLAS
jgi:hypothetical protein